MSRDRGRRFYDVAIEPSASAFLQASSQAVSRADASSSRQSEVAAEQQSLPSYFALNFNFKPDSTHDCKKGALYQPGPSRSSAADWQFELESNEVDDSAHAGSSTDASNEQRKKPAHIFTGPQTAAKAYDVVLIWDQEAQVYRLDRVAATFSLKYERSKTTYSSESRDAWTKVAKRPKKRPVEPSTSQKIASTSDLDRRDTSHNSTFIQTRQSDGTLPTSRETSKSSLPSNSSSRQAGLKLRSRESVVAAPLRRSSRRSLAVEMEEFDDRSGPSAEPAADPTPTSSKRSLEPQPANSQRRLDPKKAKVPPLQDHPSPTEAPAGLRRSRRRSSQAQAEESSSPSQSHTPSAFLKVIAKEDEDEPEKPEADEDDLAMQLERELERELDIDMEVDGSEDEPHSPPPPPARTRTALSPVSRLKLSDRQSTISTPKAHTPDLEDAPLLHLLHRSA